MLRALHSQRVLSFASLLRGMPCAAVVTLAGAVDEGGGRLCIAATLAKGLGTGPLQHLLATGVPPPPPGRGLQGQMAAGDVIVVLFQVI